MLEERPTIRFDPAKEQDRWKKAQDEFHERRIVAVSEYYSDLVSLLRRKGIDSSGLEKELRDRRARASTTYQFDPEDSPESRREEIRRLSETLFNFDQIVEFRLSSIARDSQELKSMLFSNQDEN